MNAQLVNRHKKATDSVQEERFVKAGYEYQLTLNHLLEAMRKLYPKQEIVYRDRVKYSYADFYERYQRLSNALESLGVKQGTIVGVMEWNTHRFFELYFAVPCMGAILHTINPYFSPLQLAYIINHAKDAILFLNEEFIPTIEKIRGELKTVREYVILSDSRKTPDTKLKPAREYEELLRSSKPNYEYPDLNEDQVATLCYTSGTTGSPKGCFFSHRQLSLHTIVWASMLPRVGMDVVSGAVIHIVPMYHVHSWGFPYIASYYGLKQLFPGRFDPKIILEMLRNETRLGQKVFTACVAAAARRIFFHPEVEQYRECLKNLIVKIGGGPFPEGLAKRMEELGVYGFAGWGMTEAAPIMGACMPKAHMQDWRPDERFAWKLRTGWALPHSEQRVVDESGEDVKPNGKQQGEVVYRAPWATLGYYKDPEKSKNLWRGGWMHTGDIANIDEECCIQIVDREKDVIKSGGEWISSIKLESIISTHPKVFEVAVIGVPHEKWGERPIALVVPKPGEEVSEDELKEHLRKSVKKGEIPKWWMVDKFVFVSEIEKTGTGKFDKKLLRLKYKDILMR